jgi:type IV pilus assembly protein PilO
MLAEGSGLQIALIQPEAERIEQYFARIPVRLEVQGSYFALARFFRAVSQLPRVINMENIALSDPSTDGGEVKLKAKVLATTFRSLARGESPARAAGSGGAGNAAGRTGARR